MKHLLCQVPIFAGLDDAALGTLLEDARRIAVAADAVIAREGEVNNCMYLIESGQIAIIKNSDTAAPLVLAELKTGDFFGEMCILEAMPRSATAKAAGKATVVRLTAMAFYRLYEKSPRQHSILLLNLARDLSRRLRHLDEVFAARH